MGACGPGGTSRSPIWPVTRDRTPERRDRRHAHRGGRVIAARRNRAIGRASRTRRAERCPRPRGQRLRQQDTDWMAYRLGDIPPDRFGSWALLSRFDDGRVIVVEWLGT